MKRNRIGTILVALGRQLTNTTFTDQHMKAIREAAPDSELIVIQNEEELKQQSDEIATKVEVFLGNWRWYSHFDKFTNLKWFQQGGTGAGWLLKCPKVAESEMIMTNGAGTHAIPIAEHIIAIMLMLSRGLHHHVHRQKLHAWDRSGTAVELEGATMGVIGVGRIGEKAAEKAKGLRMKTLGLRRNFDRSVPNVDKMYGPDNLLELLSTSDWVVITAALTAETMGLIGENELKAMKRSAHIINVARGPLIQENVLIKALSEGWIAGAGLDVFEQEPLPDNSPLWDMDNVIITPHHAAASPHKINRLIDLFVENLRRYQSGEPMINLVNKQLGY